ncbi:MAG: sporulation protein YabP [Tissierellia bacterium]|nr:sporulation protein YabP [Tissierellia bacterium]
MTENRVRYRNQNIMVEDRENMTVTGVEQVESFNENTIILNTIKGGMIIKGENLNISKLNLDDGNVKIQGKINGINYSNKETPKNIMGKLFK